MAHAHFWKFPLASMGTSEVTRDDSDDDMVTEPLELGSCAEVLKTCRMLARVSGGRNRKIPPAQSWQVYIQISIPLYDVIGKQMTRNKQRQIESAQQLLLFSLTGFEAARLQVAFQGPHLSLYTLCTATSSGPLTDPLYSLNRPMLWLT